jgi:hypothetical protein
MHEDDIGRTLETEKRKWQCGAHNCLRLDEPWECGECGKKHFPEYYDWVFAHYGHLNRRGSPFGEPSMNELVARKPNELRSIVFDFVHFQNTYTQSQFQEKYKEEKSRYLNSPPTGPIFIRCEGCGATYRPGVDAVSITSDELAQMIPGIIGRIPSGMMIGRSVSLDRDQLRRDGQTILRLGPKGWICKECYKDNQWRPFSINQGEQV